ncbi:hypothetical protein L484_008281 [Morus notabilis]|uniref:Uncharacterized protein n=1 Tax=Morus notabilis TaxID=981085 RepID=W9RDR2_9ROSA|nr:hypothetical protein L484_008281 [Morus notabilis]
MEIENIRTIILIMKKAKNPSLSPKKSYLYKVRKGQNWNQNNIFSQQLVHKSRGPLFWRRDAPHFAPLVSRPSLLGAAVPFISAPWHRDPIR